MFLFREMSNLKILNLFGNQIISVNRETFSGTETNLEYLDLGFNIISEISEVDFPVLKYLNLERNNLKRIDGAFRKLSNANVLVPGIVFRPRKLDQPRFERQPSHRNPSRRFLQPVLERDQHFRQRAARTWPTNFHRFAHSRSPRLIPEFNHRN